MLHIFFAIVILVHGLIHIMGYARALQFDDGDYHPSYSISSSEKIEELLGFFWVVSYLLFLAAAVLFMLYIPLWWIPAAAGALLSQINIIINWHDAKFGTIANLIVVIVILLVTSMQL